MNQLLLVALLVVAVAFADDASTRRPRGPGGAGGKRGRGGVEGRPHGREFSGGRDMNIEGVSEENMAKLNEQMEAASPSSREEKKAVIDSWLATLPEDEQFQAAANAHHEQMMKRKGKHHRTTTPSA